MAKKSPGQWLFWWRVNEDEIDTQARQYKTLTFLKSSRGVATAFLLASAALTGMLILLSGDMWSLVDIGLLLFLAVFVYLGHRWAMIAAMVFWTLGKLVVIAGVFMGQGSAVAIISSVIWWCVFMHALYLAFRVEQRRRGRARLEAEAPAVFD